MEHAESICTKVKNVGFSHLGSSDLMQDEGLDVIAEGLDTLKNMANDLNEVCFRTPIIDASVLVYFLLVLNFFLCCTSDLQELDRQVPLMDEIDDKVRCPILLPAYILYA